MGMSQDLIDGINVLISRALDQSGYVQLRTGRILSINVSGTCNILVDEVEIKNVIYRGGGTPYVDQSVSVLKQGNMANQAIAL